jgi:hypothetical protein
VSECHAVDSAGAGDGECGLRFETVDIFHDLVEMAREVSGSIMYGEGWC